MVTIDGGERYVIGGIAAMDATPIHDSNLAEEIGVPIQDMYPILDALEEKGVIEYDENECVELTGKALGACALCQHEIAETPYHVLTHNSDNIRSKGRYVLHERCAEVLTFMLEY